MGHPKLPQLTRFFGQARTYTTRSTDEGELSPWITWPSFHRGIPNQEHGVQFLGQDPASFKGKPIWDVYRERGYSIGIFGSLQSWPPKDPGPGGFYVPDTFARDERCIPGKVEPFQRFNLKQTGANGRVVKAGSLYDPSNLAFALKLPSLGIRPRTIARVAAQLVGERLDRTRLARRPIFQGILSWEVFRSLYDPARPPAFATFFTNQVAGVMHRYWDHVFPEDFEASQKRGKGPHEDTMLFALRSVDEMIGEALRYCERNPDLLVIFASSMGQGPKLWKRRDGYALSISRVDRLLELCGLSKSDFEPLLAMVPQICARIPDAAKRGQVQKRLEAATTLSGAEKLFGVDLREDRVSITVITPTRKADIECGRFRMPASTGAAQELDWQSAGIEVHAVEPGTGYHIREGVMAAYGRGLQADPGRQDMLATQAKDFILSLAEVQ